MSRKKFNKDKFIDKESNLMIYSDYLPIHIIKNEVIKTDNNKITIEFIMWNTLSEEEERTFLNGLKNHKKQILNVHIEKPFEHYIIESQI